MQQCKTADTPAAVTSMQQQLAAALLGPAENAQYRRAVGQILHLAHERHDIQYAAKEAARSMQAPKVLDMTRAKRIVRYLKLGPKQCLLFELETNPTELTVTVDGDWASDTATRRSTIGGVLQLGGSIIGSWRRTQASESLSSAEAEV